MKIIERIVNTETGETKDIERELTNAEAAEITKAKSELAERAAKEAQAAAAKAALLQRLGITEEEAKLLLS